MANADFYAEAKRMYHEKYPGKKFDDLAASTKRRYYYQAIHEYEHRTGKPAFSQAKGSMTFQQYFLRMSEQQKKDWLGPRKYEMWKSGRYKIEDFIPPYPEKAFTVKQLKELDKASFAK